MTTRAPLPTEKLRASFDLSSLSFESTAELQDLKTPLGQERAVEAVKLGVGIRGRGYNLFVLGPSGSGKHFVVKRLLTERAAGGVAPDDQVYVIDFARPARPRALALPPGRGRVFRNDMAALVEELQVAIPAAFETNEYQSRNKRIAKDVEERHERAFTELQELAGDKGVALLRTQMGFALAPMRDGVVFEPDDFAELPEDEQTRIRANIGALETRLEETIRQVPLWQREAREAMRRLDREVTDKAVAHLMEELVARYGDLPDVAAWLRAVREDVVDHADKFRGGDDNAQAKAMAAMVRGAPGGDERGIDKRYQVNLLVDHTDTVGAPVVLEDHPVLDNLLGRVEHRQQFGALMTDHTLVMPGAMHRANGGYLLLDARRVLTAPYAWEALKRTLRSGQIRIQSLSQIVGLVSMVSLDPEPIEVDVTVVLFGERFLYYMLCQHDPEFLQLFKIAADIEDELRVDPETAALYARQVATIAREERLRPLDRGGVERIMEQAARDAGDQHKISTHAANRIDLLREADYHAGEAGSETITRAHVQAAIDAQRRRVDRIRQRSLDSFREGLMLLATSGARVGQINGLAVLQLGKLRFGRPSRISARTRLGKGQVVDIEREVELGGPIHSKGVLILTSFLAARYAPDTPLSLTASLVFEQSYGGVDGDSASLAELCCLLSSLSGVPIKQSLAVTGSVDQYGEVQPIGGVDDKIEGFFDICAERGLDGTHGCLIPVQNERHLMLDRRVVAACAAGQFSVWSVETVDQALELLTGEPAGEPDGDGAFPADSINGKVAARLEALAKRAVTFAKAAKGEGGEGGDPNS
ncbi:MAG: ATP-dependent protease [Proteobacteria bacterium]|nr:MAG: ATP-dependent protease [Pseudomonadota bacterium]